MRKSIQLVLFFILLLLGSLNLTAQKAYFVKSNTTSGDTSATLVAAISRTELTNKDTIFLMPGTYTSAFVNLNNLSNKKYLITSLYLRDTTKRNYIDQTIIDGTSQTSGNGIVYNSSYMGGAWSDSVIFTGITIQNFQTVLSSVNALSYFKLLDCSLTGNGGQNYSLISNSNGITEITHCFFNNNIGGISVSYWDSNSKINITRNKFLNHTLSSNYMPGSINSNLINVSSGSSKTVIENNLFNLCTGGATNYVVYLNYPSADSVFIRNNTFFKNDINSIKVDGSNTTNTVTIFQNNLFNSNNSNSSTEFAFSSGMKVKWLNNMTYLALNKYSGFGATDTVGGGANFVFQDLKFTGTYYPSTSSPFIGMGLPKASPLVDLDGILRPNPAGTAPEIGCFESIKSLSIVTLSNLESNGNYITLNWSSNLGPNDKGSAVYRSTTSAITAGNFIGYINSASTNSYIDSNKLGNTITSGVKYYYAIKKVGSASPIADSSDISNVLNVTPSSTVIAKPTNLQFTAAPSKLKLTWTASATTGVTYNMYRCINNNELQLLASGINTVSYVDANIVRNVNYKYKVKATNTNNNTSDFSDSVTVSTSGKNIWYVAPDGNDADLGSENLPFQSIAFALQNVITGDTVLLKKGTYTSTSAYQLDSNIVIMSYFPINNDSTFLTGTILDGQGSSTSGFITGGTTKISMSGLTIQNLPSYFYYINNNGNSQNVYILNQNIFKNNNYWNTFITTNPNSIIRNNTFVNNSAGFSFQGTINFEGNTVWAISSNGMGNTLFNINSNSTGKYFIANNRFIYNQSLFTVGNNNLSDSIFFTNNTFIAKSSNNYMNSSKYSISFNANSYRCLVRNNIFYPADNFYFGISGMGNKPQLRINNNYLNTPIKLNTNISNFTLQDTTNNIMGGNPGFVAVNSDNYQLAPTSPLIGNGLIFDRLPNNDLQNKARPFPANSNPDLGAFESNYALTAPVITAIQGGNHKLNLMWSLGSNTNIDSFYLYRTGPNTDNTLTQSVPYKAIFKDSVAFLDVSGINNIDRYYYRLKAKDINGNLSDTSNLMIGRANVEPVVITDFIGDASPSMIKLEWKHIDSAIYTYNVYRGTSSGAKILYAQNVNATNFIDSAITRGINYYYAIQTIDSIGAASANSNDLQIASNGVKWVIDAAANTVGGIGSANRPFNTISKALRFAAKNDTILLNQGIYKEQLRFNVKPVVLTSTYKNDVINAESIIQNTILDGSTLNANLNLLLDSSNITNGLINISGISINNTKGYILNNANRFNFQKVYFNSNTGSGVFNGSKLIFDSCRFVNNGPLNNMCCNNFATFTDSVILRNSYISGNFNNSSSVFNFNSYDSAKSNRPIVENNLFIKNGNNNYNGSNSYLISINSINSVVRNNVFVNNTISSISLSPNDYNNSISNSLDIINNTIISNNADGIKINMGNGRLNIANNIIQNNTTDINSNGSIMNNNNPIKAIFVNNIIGTNKGDTVLKTISNIGNLDTTSSTKNFSAEFQFVDTARQNYLPSTSSAALGAAQISYINFNYDQKGGIRPNPTGSIPDIGALESPYNISATRMINGEGSNNKVGIQWSAITNTILNKYYIYRSVNSIDSLASVLPYDSVVAPIVTYIDSNNLVNLTAYYYRVKTVDRNYNTSAYSNQIVVVPNKPLDPPISLNLLSAPRMLKLTWIDPTNKAASYKVFRGATRASVSLFANGIATNYFNDSTAKKGTTYFYCVKSVDSVGAVSDSSMFVSGSNAGNIFYVDNTVTSNGIGALTDPFNTIQAAINKSINGDTIIVKPGKYQERLSVDSAITIGSMFALNADTSYISKTIISGATITNISTLIGPKNNMNYNSGSLVLKGLQFEQFTGSLISDYQRKLTLTNCIIKSISANCNSLISAGQNSLIEKSIFSNNSGQISLNSNSTITQNQFYNQNASCNNFINANNAKLKIYNNLFANVQGIDIYLSGSDTNFVVNNTFYKTTGLYQFIRFESYSSAKHLVYNNIFNKPSGYDFLFNNSGNTMYNADSLKPYVDISYNLLDSAVSKHANTSSYNISKSRKNYTGFSPRFGNTSTNDFSLTKSSPAIGIGIDTTIVPALDLNNNVRANPVGSKPDLGAIESNIGTAAPYISSAKVEDHILNLQWQVFDTTGIANYRIYKSETDSLPTTLLTTTSDPLVVSYRDSLEYGKSFNYRIIAVKRDASASDYSDPVRVNIFAAPLIVSPLNNANKINLSDTLKWQTTGSNLLFDVQISKTESQINTDSTSITTKQFLPFVNYVQNKYYYWRVRVRDANTTSAWSSLNRFQTKVTAPVLADTNYINDRSFKLTFKYDSTDIKSVRIYKGTQIGTLKLYDSIGKLVNYTDTLNYQQPTFFGISVVNNDNVESSLSNIKQITTYTKPILLAPANAITGYTIKPTFNWSIDTLSTKRMIQISNDSTFNVFTNGYNVTLNIKSNTYSILDSSKILPNTNYYWRVRAGDLNGFGAWSNVNWFQTFVESPVFTKVSPSNKIDTLSWNKVNNGTIKFYKIYRDTIATPTKLIDSVAGDKLSYIDTAGLSLNVKYFYRLKAVNNLGIESDYSNVLFATPFNTKPVPVSLISKTFDNTGEYNSIRLVYSATGSVDPDGKIIGYKWYVNDSLVNASDSILIYYFNQGLNDLRLTITDNDGATSTATAQIKMSAFVKKFKGGILGGITALNESTLYTADSTFDAINGASVYKMDRKGNTVFPLIVSSKIFTTPSVSSDSSVFITSGSTLNGFNSSGAPLWSTIPLGGLSYVTPTIDSLQNRLYVGVSNANFFAIDYKTGKVAWNILCDAPINSSAIITGDRKLIFGSDNGTLYGFDLRKITGQPKPTWQYSVPGKITKSPAVDSSNNLFFGTQSGSLVKLKLETSGTVTTIWTASLGSAIQSSPVIDGKGFVYVGTESGKFYKLNPENGNIIWSYTSKGAIRSTPTISSYGNIYIADKSGFISSISESGSLNWKYQDSSAISSNLLSINNMTYVGTEGGRLIGFYDNPATNTVNTSLSYNSQKIITPFYAGSMAKVNKFSAIGGYVNQMLDALYLPPAPNPAVEIEPLWGTFQGNYRRTGSKKFECPTIPVINIPNCTTTSDSIRISTSDMTDKYWVVNDIVLQNVTDTAIYVKTSEPYKLMASNGFGCTVSSAGTNFIANSNIEKPLIVSSNGSTKFCEGDSIVLSSSIIARKYQWNYSGSTVTGATTKAYTTNIAGGFSVTATNNYGCSATSDVSLIMVNALPTLAAITGKSTLCAGTNTIMTNATSSGVWSSSNISVATVDANGLLTGVLPGIDTLSYTVKNANGCQSTATTSITVVAAPTAPVITANGPTTFCSGGNVVLTASTSTGNQWYKDGIAITGATNNTYTANATSSITDTVVNASGCKAGSLATLVVMDPQSSPVKPIISSLTNDTTVCFRDSIVLQSSNYYNKYLWSTGDTLQTITVKKSDNISLRGSASGSNCFSVPSATLSLIKNVNVLPVITYGTSSLISSKSNYYKWFYNNLPAAGVFGYTFTNPAQGFYHVETSLDNFCWDASFDYVVVLTNTPLINDSVTVTTYPNPSIGTFNVVADFEKLTNVVTKIIVSDMTGKVIYQSQKMIFLSKKIIIPVNLGTSKGTFAVNMDINGTIKTVIIVVN